MKDVFISDVGLARFGKREESIEELVIEALIKLNKNSALDKMDAVFLGNMSGEKFIGISNLSSWIVDHVSLTGRPAFRIETGSSSGAGAFQVGFQAVASGCYQNVLVVAGEKMTHIPTEQATGILAEVIDPVERMHGCTMTALAAMITRRYMYEYSLTEEEQALIPVKNHYNGSLNPYAHFQKRITTETVLDSKVIASPLRLYDCSPISDGAAAIILTSKPGPVRIAGIGHGTEYVAVNLRKSLTSFSATRLAAKKAYEMANLKPNDIDFAEVHDAFSSFELINTEDLGFFGPGKGREALINGETKLDGKIPINPSGGLKARGHPVGVSGLAQVVEVFWQLCDKAGKRQVKGAKTALSQSIGGLASNNLVNIFEAV